MGKFINGQEKPTGSGRRKGTRNKKSEALEAILDSLGFNLVDELIKRLPKLSPEKQADIILGLMPFVYPKKKAIDLDGNSASGEIPSKIEIEYVSPK